MEHLTTRPDVIDASFWSTHAGAELDLRLQIGPDVFGVEVKRTDRPSTSKSMHAALGDLGLAHLFTVHAGDKRSSLSEDITAVPASDVLMASTAADALLPET